MKNRIISRNYTFSGGGTTGEGGQTFDDYMTNNIEKIAPEVGEHNEEVYCGLLDYSPDDLKRWKHEKIISEISLRV